MYKYTMKTSTPGVEVVVGSFCPETDSVGGNGPSSDGYGSDGYGYGYTVARKETGIVEVTLSESCNKVLHASAAFQTTIAKDLIAQAEFPCPKSGGSTVVRFRILVANVETDLEHNDRMTFEIWTLKNPLS